MIQLANFLQELEGGEFALPLDWEQCGRFGRPVERAARDWRRRRDEWCRGASPVFPERSLDQEHQMMMRANQNSPKHAWAD